VSELVAVSPPRTAHRADCTFGPGYYRLILQDGTRRYCQSEAEIVVVRSLLLDKSIRHIQRDGYCLDQQTGGTPDVLDGEQFLALPKDEAMRALGDVTEAEYIRAYRAVEDAVLARDRAISAGARDRPSIVIKRKGRRVADVAALPVPR